jgi:hypothetical protein
MCRKTRTYKEGIQILLQALKEAIGRNGKEGHISERTSGDEASVRLRLGGCNIYVAKCLALNWGPQHVATNTDREDSRWHLLLPTWHSSTSPHSIPDTCIGMIKYAYRLTR